MTPLERERYQAEIEKRYEASILRNLSPLLSHQLRFSQGLSEQNLQSAPLKEIAERNSEVVVLHYPNDRVLRLKELREWLKSFSKPVFFDSVPIQFSIKAALPLLASPKVVGWEWDEKGATPELLQMKDSVELNAKKLIHYLDSQGFDD